MFTSRVDEPFVDLIHHTNDIILLAQLSNHLQLFSGKHLVRMEEGEKGKGSECVCVCGGGGGGGGDENYGKQERIYTKVRGKGSSNIRVQAHINDLTFPSGLFGLLTMIILVREEKAASSSPGSNTQSLEEPLCFPCYRNV